jgi:ubiquinone/menaquinone biosynthesis C-methylase UbiE
VSEEERRRLEQVYRGYAASAATRERWSAENPGNRAIRAELTAAVRLLAGAELRSAAAVLDVGCGGGWWLAWLAGEPSIAARLHGIELLGDRVLAARERVASAAILAGDARRLPYEPASFEVVTLFTVLSSLPAEAEIALVLGEARRVLRPGGVLLVWEPRIPTPDNAHTLLVRRAVLETALAGMALSSRTTTLLPPLARRLGRHTDRLYPRLSALAPLRTHRLLCARAPGAG